MERAVVFSWNGQFLPSYSIDATDIADLSLGPSKPPAPANQNHVALETPKPPQQQQQQQQQPFVDPAILSFAKPSPAQVDSSGHVPPPHRARGPSTQPPDPSQRAEPTVSAALSEPFSSLELDGSVPTEQRRKSRGKKGKVRAGAGAGGLEEQDETTGKRGGGTSNTNPKSKGWRQTAFVEPSNPYLQSPQRQSRQERPAAQVNGRRRKKKSRESGVEDPNEWATEDPTDIQELPEFDFQSNLSKFDKRRVFAEIRNDDTTADEERLVSFNKKLPKPGTNGGKNLHWSENVLDSPRDSENDDSEQEGDEEQEEVSEAKASSGNYSGREFSRASTRSQASRRASTNPMLGQQQQQHQPLVPPPINAIGRSQLSSSRTTSPLPNKQPSISASPMNVAAGSGASLRLTTTNRSCPTVSPLQALEVEQIAVAELGLTENMISENAGRDIAEAAVGLLPNDSAAPTMLVLAGNHRTGARAICAARHLRNRGHRVTACMLGLQQESELLESCRRQLDIFKKVGGRVFRWEELSARLSTAEFEPDLVLDALLGIHMAFEDLRTDQQATAFEMISWANRSNVDMLSVDIPSGYSASSGELFPPLFMLELK